MTTIGAALPMLGLRISAGPLELRGISDEDLVALAALVADGIHDPERMPFAVPWTDVPADQVLPEFARYHWRTRASFSPESWSLNLAVRHDGELVGVQGIDAVDYLVTRTGETGSWLARRHQGRGLGTAMRQVICAFMFDHLDAVEVSSRAFADNPASLAVSRKVGYVENGRSRQQRRPGELAESVGLVLSPERFVRGEHPLEVEGLAAFRCSLGLDSD